MGDLNRATTFEEGLEIGLADQSTAIFTGTVDPSVSGEVAPPGSIYLRNIGGVTGEVWQKTGAANNAWTLIAGGGGGATAMNDLTDADTVTDAPQVGDSLKWDGVNWVPGSAITDENGSTNYFFVFKTVAQQVTTRATFEDITFDTEVFVQGWTHTPGSAEFQCDFSGVYMGTLEIGVEKSGGNGVESAIRAVIGAGAIFNEIPGSHNGMDITSNNTIFAISRTFIFSATAGQIIKMQYATDSNGNFNLGSSAKITPVPTANADNSTVSATFNIRRMT
jgi:hypothetical protein